MKIGFITLKEHKQIAGTERVLMTVIESLNSSGIDTCCYLIAETENHTFLEAIGKYKTAYIPKLLRKKHLLRPRALYKLMRKRGIKKLFQQIEEDHLDALFVLKIEDEFLQNHDHFITLKKNCPNLKLIAWPHCDLRKIMDRETAYGEKLKIFDVFYAISDGIADELQQELQCTNVIKIYNPVDPAPPIPREINRFLYIGRIDKDKRVTELLTTLDQLDNKEWQLDIIGSTGSEEKNNEFKDFINSLQQSVNIHFHGWSNDPWRLVDSAGVLLLNSRTEGFSLILVEAMIRGIACISTNCPVGPASIIQNGVNGWLVDLYNEQQLIDLLERVLKREISLPPSQQIIASVDRFTTQNVIDNFVKYLDELLK